MKLDFICTMFAGIFQELRANTVREWITKEHPQIKVLRGVVLNEKAAYQSPNIIAVPAIRVICYIKFLNTLCTYICVRLYAVYRCTIHLLL